MVRRGQGHRKGGRRGHGSAGGELQVGRPHLGGARLGAEGERCLPRPRLRGGQGLGHFL